MPEWRALQDAFLAEAGAGLGLAALDTLEDTFFFVKDRARRFVYCNVPFLTMMGLDVDAIIGRRDEDISPEYLVEKYRHDDEAVLAGGRLEGEVELAHSPMGGFDWFVTTKYPVHGRAAEIVGVAGITRHLMPFERAETATFAGLEPAIELIARDFGRRLKIADLAGAVSMSTSQFTRVFRQRFGVSPHRYLQQVRTNAACDLLSTTDEPIAVVAQRTGFYDQSHLTNHFVRERGLTPRAYRERYARPAR